MQSSLLRAADRIAHHHTHLAGVVAQRATTHWQPPLSLLIARLDGILSCRPSHPPHLSRSRLILLQEAGVFIALRIVGTWWITRTSFVLGFEKKVPHHFWPFTSELLFPSPQRSSKLARKSFLLAKQHEILQGIWTFCQASSGADLRMAEEIR